MSISTWGFGTIEVLNNKLHWDQATLVTLANLANTAIRLACLCEDNPKKASLFRVANQLWAILLWSHRANKISNLVYILPTFERGPAKGLLNAETYPDPMLVVSPSGEAVCIPMSKVSPKGINALIGYSFGPPSNHLESNYRTFRSELADSFQTALEDALTEISKLDHSEILRPNTGAMRFLVTPESDQFLKI